MTDPEQHFLRWTKENGKRPDCTMTSKTYLKNLGRNHGSNKNTCSDRSNMLRADRDNPDRNRMVRLPGTEGKEEKKWLDYQKKNRQGGMAWIMPTAC